MMTLQNLQNLIQSFCEERDWDQFHTPKDLAIGVATEGGELLDLFRFKTETQIQELLRDEKFRTKLNDEIADVLFFILRMAQMNNIDLEQALKNKMSKNAEKYPVQTARGSNKKYNE